MIHIYKAGGDRETSTGQKYTIDYAASRQDCPKGWSTDLEDALSKNKSKPTKVVKNG